MITTPKTASQKTPAKGVKTPPLAPTHFHNPNHKSSNSMRMKSTSLTLAAAAVLAALPLANAQNVTATTDPVGFQQTSVPNGFSSLANPLINSNTLSGSVVSNTTSSVVISGITNIGTLLTAGEPYYLEVVSGTLEGERFELDTASTIASANSTTVLSQASPNNTSTLNTGALVGSSIAIRKHITLEQLQSYFSPSLVGNNSANSADQVSVYDTASGNLKSYFLRADNTTWRLVGSTTVANKTIVPPGTGFFVTKRSGVTTFTSVGGVRTNNFAMPMSSGQVFAAPAYPIGYSPSALGGTSSEGWSGSNSAASADQLSIYDPTQGTFVSYFLRADGVTWRQVGTTTTVTNNQLFTDNNGFMIRRNTSDSNYILPNPIQ